MQSNTTTSTATSRAISLALLKEEQRSLSGRLSAARYRIRRAEEDYANIAFGDRRNIHLQGAIARFLLAGLLQHRPSQQDFEKLHACTYDINAGGPSELCPIIDIFEDVRIAQNHCEEWLHRPADHTIAQIRHRIVKAEKVAWNIQVLLSAVLRGGDETPPLFVGGETIDEFCDRIQAHHVMVCDSLEGYDGQWRDVPSNDVELSSQQIVGNWNAVCGILVERPGVTLEVALWEVKMATRNMEFEELAWTGQRRVWFGWQPRLGL